VKNILIPFLFLIVIFNSCSTDDNTEIGDPNPTSEEEPVITATESCLFSDFNIQENSTITIDCLLDLEGATIDLPTGVTFNFDGGDIFNGTLNFGTAGKIAGPLLNSDLTLDGDVSLIDEEFQFIPSRWTMVQGETTKNIALENNQKLERLFYQIKELGGSTFKIDRFDAYFEVTTVTSTTSDQNFRASLESLNIPSDFNLMMTDNTHLRIYPYSQESAGNGSLLGVREVENVTISGGNLHGDRYEYFLTDDNEEGNRLLTIRSGKNIVIDNVYFENASVSAATINSQGFSFNDDYDPTENITIKNSTFFNNRGLSITITDGRNITIENNEFIDSGQPTTYSDGGAVGYAIDVEPVRERDSSGNLIEFQKVFDVLIKGNKETNSRAGFLILFVGQDIIVEDNSIDTRMAWSFMSGVRIRKNVFNATNSWASESWAFFAGGNGETVFDNEFSDNTITGYSIGIDVGSEDADIFDNTITNVSTGIQINEAFNTTINNNIIEAENRGIRIGNTFADNVNISKNIITAGVNSISISAANEDAAYEDFSIVIDDNTFDGEGSVSLFRTNGITFSNNDVTNTGLSIAGNVSNTIISRNTIIPTTTNGIRVHGDNHENITISNNTISIPTGTGDVQCISNESTTPDQVALSGNMCN